MMSALSFSSFAPSNDRKEYATLPPIHEAIPEIRQLPRIQPRGAPGRPLTPLSAISPAATRPKEDLPSPDNISGSGHNRCLTGASQPSQTFVEGPSRPSHAPRSTESRGPGPYRSEYHGRHDPHHRVGFPSPSSPAVALPTPQSRPSSGRASPYGETQTPSPIEPPNGFMARDEEDTSRYPRPYSSYERREARPQHLHGVSGEPSYPVPFTLPPNRAPQPLGGRDNVFSQPISLLTVDRHPNGVHLAHLPPFSPTNSAPHHHHHHLTTYRLDSFGLTPRQKTKLRKRRGNLPKWATDILRQWFLEHIDHPYPTEEEKKTLGSKTHLSINQISNWFINARRRQLPNLIKDAKTESIARKNQGADDQAPSPTDPMDYDDDDDVLDSDVEDCNDNAANLDHHGRIDPTTRGEAKKRYA